MSYQYIGEEGDFCVKNPEKISYLYFPLAGDGRIDEKEKTYGNRA